MIEVEEIVEEEDKGGDNGKKSYENQELVDFDGKANFYSVNHILICSINKWLNEQGTLKSDIKEINSGQ